MSAVDASEPRRREMNKMNRGRSNACSTLPHYHSSRSLAKGVTREARSVRLAILVHLHRFGHELIELTNTCRVCRVSG